MRDISALKYAEDHLKEIARKSIAADEKLHDLFIEIAGITSGQAYNLVNYYKRKKLVKLDLTNATLNVKHGSYLDKDMIEYLSIHEAF